MINKMIEITSNNIKGILKSKGLTQREFCDNIDMTTSHFNRIVKNKSQNISLITAKRIAIGLEMNIEDVFIFNK